MPTPKTPARSKFLTPNEVADRLLITPVTVRLWASRGLLPSVTTPGGHRRFCAEDIDAFIARQREARRRAVARPTWLLIIDGDPEFAAYLEALIRSRVSGIDIDIAPDGFVAGMKCEAIRPDVVTLDLHMPGMDGIAVCRALRGMPARGDMRIVALTGFPSEENVGRMMAAGANSCLAKTVPPELLLKELGLLAG